MKIKMYIRQTNGIVYVDRQFPYVWCDILLPSLEYIIIIIQSSSEVKCLTNSKRLRKYFNES